MVFKWEFPQQENPWVRSEAKHLQAEGLVLTRRNQLLRQQRLLQKADELEQSHEQ